MKLALDNQVSDKIARILNNSGHTIVYHAGHEHDELWLNLAYQKGAEVYISPDYDVENFAYNNNLEFIRFPQKHKNVTQMILNKLKAMESRNEQNSH